MYTCLHTCLFPFLHICLYAGPVDSGESKAPRTDEGADEIGRLLEIDADALQRLVRATADQDYSSAKDIPPAATSAQDASATSTAGGVAEAEALPIAMEVVGSMHVRHVCGHAVQVCVACS